MPAMAKIACIGVLMIVGLGAAALRDPSPIQGDHASPTTDNSSSNSATGSPNTSNMQPFDLSYLPPKAVGFQVFRPAAIAKIPACKPQLEKLNAMLAKEFPAGMPKIESIEQMTIEFSIRPRDSSKKQPGRVMSGACMVRTVDSFDWMTAIKTFTKRLHGSDLQLAKAHIGGLVYYKSTGSQFPRPFGPDAFYFPDSRTIVWDYEDNLRAMISQAKRTGPAFVPGDDWRKVDGGLLAMAIDTRDQRFKLDVTTDEPEDLPIAPLLRQPDRWVLGIDGAQSLNFRAIASCASGDQRELVARTAESLLVRARVALGQTKPTTAKDDLKDEITTGVMRLANEFVQTSVVRREGSGVDISANSRSNADTLLGLILALIAG
jgi:hypothetical protein